jgi:hypothetical protein
VIESGQAVDPDPALRALMARPAGNRRPARIACSCEVPPSRGTGE